jgi:hypothetical protein
LAPGCSFELVLEVSEGSRHYKIIYSVKPKRASDSRRRFVVRINRSTQSIYSGCVSPMTCPTSSVAVSATTNQLTSPYAYDASGNMTNDGSNTLAYDGENRTASATNSGASGTYSYDGKGLRIKKVAGSTTTVYVFSARNVIAEYDNGAAPTALSREYLYSGATLIAKFDSTGTHYYHRDHLSNRLVTDSSGNVAEQLGHYPFGESWYNTSDDKLFFTTYILWIPLGPALIGTCPAIHGTKVV